MTDTVLTAHSPSTHTFNIFIKTPRFCLNIYIPNIHMTFSFSSNLNNFPSFQLKSNFTPFIGDPDCPSIFSNSSESPWKLIPLALTGGLI